MSSTPTCKINLALQGGGSHGALTWGVLDALLEDGSLVFDGISGTSAGAMNAVALAQGFAQAARQESDPVAAQALGDPGRHVGQRVDRRHLQHTGANGFRLPIQLRPYVL